jgi:hypothetical protein
MCNSFPRQYAFLGQLFDFVVVDGSSMKERTADPADCFPTTPSDT